jgi:hypothetical protein
MKNEKFNRKDLVSITGLIIAIIALLFGNNLYERSTGHSVFSPKTPTPVFVPTVISSVTPVSATAEATNWAFVLEYRFPVGFWTAGAHSYSFAWTCPNEVPDSVTRNFTVSDNFPPVLGDVYLRWSSLRVGDPWGESVEGINPSQSTVASVVWDTITKSEAEWRASNCAGTVSWDGGAAETLAGVPFQH